MFRPRASPMIPSVLEHHILCHNLPECVVDDSLRVGPGSHLAGSHGMVVGGGVTPGEAGPIGVRVVGGPLTPRKRLNEWKGSEYSQAVCLSIDQSPLLSMLEFIFQSVHRKPSIIIVLTRQIKYMKSYA